MIVSSDDKNTGLQMIFCVMPLPEAVRGSEFQSVAIMDAAERMKKI
ncbi:hypothetical protein [Enterobacter chuandaensis]|nr:hypothetical protein [Enterobacter chuandaensis]